MPRLPFRSAVPSVSMRPVSVTIPAPMTTPKIPSSGLCESSDGKPAAIALAICDFVGECSTAICVDIFAVPLVRRSYRGGHRESGTQLLGLRKVVEYDLHRDALHDFRVVAGGVVRRQ